MSNTIPIQKLTGKIFIKGTISAQTGLRIGGNKSSLEIGGVDLSVIKTAEGVPYIPGSSIKGKLRGLLCKVRGSGEVKTDPPYIKDLFGDSGGKEARGITRLFVRDAVLDTGAFVQTFTQRDKRDFDYSEIKTENVINRSKGTAEHPRQVERVPAGAIFKFQMVLDVYEGDDAKRNLQLLDEAFQLLEMDYLGGHGSRGSGQVAIALQPISGKQISEEGISNMEGTNLPWQQLFSQFITQPAVS